MKISNITGSHFKLNNSPQYKKEANRIWKRVINVQSTLLGLICSNN